jgi:Ca-activated chloride channel family protein
MDFLWPYLLWLLLAIPVLVAAYILMQRRRQRFALRYASLSLVKEAIGRGPGFRRHIPAILYLIGLTAMIIALARPVHVVTLPSQEGTVILTIDVSGSMRAEDLAPTRLEAAKAAARTFVESQPPGVRIGVVSFSDNAFLVQAPTKDKEAVVAAINRLQNQRSTAIGRALLTSIDAIFEGTDEEVPPQRPMPGAPTPAPTPTPTPVPKGTYAPAVIVLLTDGENNQFPPPLSIVDQVAARGVRVFTVGIGSADGVVVRNQGRSMRTRLDEETLKRIAEATDGEYFNATNTDDLQAIYERLSLHLVFRTEKAEITALFTAVAVVVSLVAGVLSLLWFSRLP